jgi:superfamily II DNA or RNA helicase
MASKDFAHLHKLLSFDMHRNELITKAIRDEVSQKRKVLVIAERKDHLESLKYFLRKNVDTLIMTGTISAVQKRYRMTRIKNGTFQVILATGQFFGEGVDASEFDSLFLVSPISFEGKLVQYMGRLRKGGSEKRIFDVRDPKVDLLEKCFKKRKSVYTGMVKSGELRMENGSLF